jgi:hypothetical protein
MHIFFIILLLFLLFASIQIYFYKYKFNNNIKIITKIESFESSLKNINNQNEFFLNDQSLNLLLDDYNKLKESNIL